MTSVDIVATVALLQYLVLGGFVSRARGLYGVKAPAITGHAQFERAYRVQMNTLELLVAFLPALYIAARYWPSATVAGIGAVYLAGRLVYWYAYLKDPARRSLGFIISAAPVFVLVVAALAGAVLGRNAA